MKYLLLSLLSLTAECSKFSLDSKFEKELLHAEFHNWKNDHSKEYETTKEHDERLAIWIKNHEKIEAHNQQTPQPSFLLGHNEYSDMTQSEFKKHFKLGKKVIEKEVKAYIYDEELALETMSAMKTLDLPDHVDWVQMGGVTSVKNQGACGSCWAFSTTGALEGAKFIRTGELTALSEQNLIDCDHKDLGCSGGLMDDAFKFDEKSGGLCSESDYPYKAAQGKTCMTNCTDVPGSLVKTFVDVPEGDARALLSGIAMQPVSVAIQADQFAFQFYRTGVITDDSCGEHAQVDHGVLAVGYGTDLDTQTPYWLVKNSWGATWGDEGYVKLARNSTNDFGMCAILKMASFPVVE